MKSYHCLELDVFLIDTETCVSRYTELTKNCSFFQVFQCPQELFVCFSSILIRMYIDCTLNALFFSPPKVKHKAFNVSLVDEKKILLIILRNAKIFLDKFWHTKNFNFFLIFLISLILLIPVPVLKIMNENLNLVHTIFLIIVM